MRETAADRRAARMHRTQGCLMRGTHCFSTLDRIKKYDDSDNEENAEKPYSIKVGETKRTINLYAIATTKFQIAV